MKRFEYDNVALRILKDANGYSFESFVAALAQRGADGWELCGFEYGCAFFKRQSDGSVRESLESYRVTTEELLGIQIPKEGPLEFALCLMRAVHSLRVGSAVQP